MTNIRYNVNTKQYIYLDEGEDFCKKCDGKGRVMSKNKVFESTNRYSLICDKCLGCGKIDWLEKITGKKYLPDELSLTGGNA